MRAVLDANVIVSAAYTFEHARSSLPEIFRAGLRGQYVLLTSDPIIEEVQRVLSRPFFTQRVPRQRIDLIVSEIAAHSEHIEIQNAISGVASHWQDDRILETALEGDADYLVTGDRELLDLEHPFRFRIVHPNEFHVILSSASA